MDRVLQRGDSIKIWFDDNNTMVYRIEQPITIGELIQQIADNEGKIVVGYAL